MASCTEAGRRVRRSCVAAALLALWWLAPGVGRARAADDDRVLLEVDSTPTAAPYVQARLIYRLRVAARVPLRQATLSDPGVTGATIQRLGDDRRWSEERDGERYSVLERRWAIVPERAGPLVIDGPTLAAAVPAGTGAESGLIERLETLHRQAGALRLAVRPPPAGAEAPWLAAEAVSISERWEPVTGEAHVGVPLTRTVVVEAAAALPAQLPALPALDAPGFKVYPEAAVRDQQPAGDDLLARLSQRISYVPVAPGRFEVPPLRVPWWNLGLDAPRQALLGARTFTVAGGVANAEATVTAAAVGPSAAGDAAWPAISALFAALWAGTLWWCARRSRRARNLGPDRQAARTGGPPRAPEVLTPGLAARRFEVACRTADARGARAALLAYGAVRWPVRTPQGLDALMLALGAGAEARAQAAAIDRALYGAVTGDWEPTAAAAAIAPLLRVGAVQAAAAGGRTSVSASLPDLYPPGGGP